MLRELEQYSARLCHGMTQQQCILGYWKNTGFLRLGPFKAHSEGSVPIFLACSETRDLTMGEVSRKSVQLLQQQHGRRYRAQGGISSGTQVGLVRQLYQCHEVSAGVYETPL